MSVQRRIAAFLDLAAADADAAIVLAERGNRYAAYHCQQAAEKLIKAHLIFRGIEHGREHRLDVLLAKLPEGDPWLVRLREFEGYTPYATTFRYPGVAGRVAKPPDAAEVSMDAQRLLELIAISRRELIAR
jgi:HEPN domain-containing protein